MNHFLIPIIMMKTRKLSFLSMVCLLLTYIPSYAQEKPSLQTLFKESSSVAKAKANASDDVIVIDLDEWQNEYDETLNIATGKKYKFTNGELKWIGGEAPLITVSNGSSATFVSGVTVSGNDKRSDNDDKHRSPLIIIKDGNVVVDGATFYANTYIISPFYYYSDVFCFEETSSTNGVSGYLELYNCNAKGSVTNESQYGEIYMYGYGNKIDGGVRTNAEVSMDIRLNKVAPIYQNAKQSVSKAVRYIDSFFYNGTIDLASHGVINLRSSLSKKDLIYIFPAEMILTLPDTKVIDVDADSYSDAPRKIAQGSNGYQISESDLEALQVKDLDTQKYELVLRDNAVYIQQKSITGQQWLQEQINSYVDITTDTDEQPGIITIPEEGIELTDLLTVPKGAFVRLVGGPISVSTEFQNADFVVYIQDNAHLNVDEEWDFAGLASGRYLHSVFWNGGHLTFGDNSVLRNTDTKEKKFLQFIYNGGSLDFSAAKQAEALDGRPTIILNGCFVNGGNVTIHNGYVQTSEIAINAESCTMYKGTINSVSFNTPEPFPTIKADKFIMHGGAIYSRVIMDVDYAELHEGLFKDGESYVNTITTSGDVDFHKIIFKDNDQEHCVYLTSTINNRGISISANWESFDLSKPYVLVSGKNYQITQEDLSKITANGLDMEKYELVLENNNVIIREKGLAGQQWLQEQINSYVDITTDTDEQPGVITIPEEGIELTDLLIVPKGAFVKLVGGPITISKDFDPSPDFAIRIYKDAHLFIDNTWDFNALPVKAFAYIFANNGHLSFEENSTLLNTWSEAERRNAFIQNYGRLDFNNPNSCTYGNEIRINGSFVDGGNHGTTEIRDGYIHTEKSAITAGNCYIYGGTIDCGEIAVKAVELYLFDGIIAGDIDVKCAYLTKGSFHYTTSYIGLEIYSSGDIRDHTIVLKNYSNESSSYLVLTSELTHKQHIKADWKNLDFSSPRIVVCGIEYQLTQQDCDNFIFDDLPSDVRAKLDGNTIVLTKEKKNLHDLFDEIADGGTEDNPTDVMGDEDEVSADEPEDMKDDLHILFGDPEDKDDGNESTKAFMLSISGEYGIRIPATSSIEFKNINIDLGENAMNSFIEVYGKLIINTNVYIRNVCTCTEQVIYVRPGGTLVWRGGINNIPGVVIYNDGGTVIYEGGNTYGTTYGIHNANDGKIIIKDGSIGGGEYAIYNPSNGEINIYDGSVINGDIYSNDNITTGGSVGISTIYIPWNRHINLTSSITTDWSVNISDIQNINIQTAFIYGTGGYKLTEEDLEHIRTDLPEKYCLILDVNMNIIYIVDRDSAGIDNNIFNARKVEKIFSIDGKQTMGGNGIRIVRYSDGTIHKVAPK